MSDLVGFGVVLLVVIGVGGAAGIIVGGRVERLLATRPGEPGEDAAGEPEEVEER